MKKDFEATNYMLCTKIREVKAFLEGINVSAESESLKAQIHTLELCLEELEGLG